MTAVKRTLLLSLFLYTMVALFQWMRFLSICDFVRRMMTTVTKRGTMVFFSDREGKLNVSVRPRGSVLSVFIILRACACGVHVRFESRRQKSNYRLTTSSRYAKGERVVSSRGARGSLISYRMVYLTYQHILQTAFHRRSVFAPIRNSSHTNDDRRPSKIEDLFRVFFFYIKGIMIPITLAYVLDQAKNGSSPDIARN